MTLKDAWVACIALLQRAGLDPLQACRPGVDPTSLIDAEVPLGLRFTPELNELYQLADGMVFVQGLGAHALPGLDFPDLAASVSATLALRENSAGLERLWRPSWFRVFHFAHAVHWAVDVDTGMVWYVDWQEDDIYPTAETLAKFLIQTADEASDADLRYEHEGRYFSDPDGIAWEAPHSPLGTTGVV
ncbi:MAG: hypothetical protein LCH96_15445 [Actinobacteria bacterium]|nr:hypothetical protein [Actinomycetota bacterium]